MTAQQIVDLLNDAFKADPKAIDALLCASIPCNDALLNHPTIMVNTKNKNNDFPVIRVLGLLAGIAAIDNQKIAAIYDDEAHCLAGFTVLDK